jgi:hypothetical protein
MGTVQFFPFSASPYSTDRFLASDGCHSTTAACALMFDFGLALFQPMLGHSTFIQCNSVYLYGLSLRLQDRNNTLTFIDVLSRHGPTKCDHSRVCFEGTGPYVPDSHAFCLPKCGGIVRTLTARHDRGFSSPCSGFLGLPSLVIVPNYSLIQTGILPLC